MSANERTDVSRGALNRAEIRTLNISCTTTSPASGRPHHCGRQRHARCTIS